MTPRVEVHADKSALATAVAQELLARLTQIQTLGREPHVVLTGGSVAALVHREIARLSPNTEVDWTRVVLWWGDERFVADGSQDRNAGGARSDFLDAVGATQVHPMPGADNCADVDEAAGRYAELLRTRGPELFDVVLLSLGPDGHVASLFPGSEQLDMTHAALAVHDSPKPPPERVTLSRSTLSRAHSVWLMASGEEKAEAVEAALSLDGSIHQTPARGVDGQDETIWFLDKPAATLL